VKELVQKGMEHNSKVLKEQAKTKKPRKPRQKKAKGKQI
jgi:hypothetical protein